MFVLILLLFFLSVREMLFFENSKNEFSPLKYIICLFSKFQAPVFCILDY